MVTPLGFRQDWYNALAWVRLHGAMAPQCPWWEGVDTPTPEWWDPEHHPDSTPCVLRAGHGGAHEWRWLIDPAHPDPTEET